jgi:hypothetical protein
LSKWRTRFRITLVPDDVTPEGMALVYALVRWGLEVLYDGAFSAQYRFGNDWADAQRRGKALHKLASAFDASGALADIGGDWKWPKEAFHLKQHYGVAHCCVGCGAAKSLMHGPLYSDLRKYASWLGTNRDCMEYVQ